MKQNNRDKVLKTAGELFLKHGYNGVSIRQIASKANLTTGAVYFHFKNKKEIYNTICSESVVILIDKFKKGSSKKRNPQQKLISTYDSFMAFYYDNRDHYNLLMEYKAEYNAGEGKNEIIEKITELLDLMKKIIQSSMDDGVYRRMDAFKLTLFLAAVAEGMLQYKKLGIVDAMSITDDEFRSFMIDVISKGIVS